MNISYLSNSVLPVRLVRFLVGASRGNNSERKMPKQLLVAQHLADILSVIAHPHRIRIIEELGSRECDVQTLAVRLKLRQSTLSQHLALLKSRGIAKARRDGRTVRYSLNSTWLAQWLIDGLKLFELQKGTSNEVVRAAKAVRRIWKARSQ